MSRIDVTRRKVLGGAATAAVATAVAPKVLARVGEPQHEFSTLSKLDDLQSGHLRHFRNTLALADGDWGTMVSDDPMHAGDFTGYQYQLSSMAHSLGTAHLNRMPHAPGFFRTDMDRVVRKMLLPEVWQYWFTMSQGDPRNDPSLKEPLKPLWDPVARDNIMYSGHLNQVAALYGYLFNDDKYDAPNAFVFRNYQDPFGKRTAEYGLKSLNDVIYWQYVQNGHIGVACFPNAVFLGCSQFPLWGMKWQDTRLGGSRADETIESHNNAWKRFGGFQPGQEMPFLWFAKQKQLAREGGKNQFDEAAPIMTAMNWSQWIINGTMPEYAESVWPFVSAATLARDTDGALVVVSPAETGTPGERYKRGRDILAGRPAAAPRKKPGRNDAYAGLWGWFAQNMSERQDPRLTEILAYVDANMNPTWENGGLYYPVRDETWVDDKFVGVTPTSGNVHFAYARLNVENGINKLVNSKWGAEHFAEPNLSAVSRDVDVVRGIFLPERQALVVTVRPYRGGKATVANFEFANLMRRGQGWTLEQDGQLAARGKADEVLGSTLRGTVLRDGKLAFSAPVERETTLVLRFA
jgi:hypothetical protein